MKKTGLTILFCAIIAITAFAQEKKVEVLYFKANLGCCQGRACNILQSEIDKTIAQSFADKNIEFKVVRLADEKNKEMIQKYNAKSQSVILVNKKRKKEKVVDLTPIVETYKKDKNKEKFEKELKIKIKKAL